MKELYEIGEIPPCGYVPRKMYAWTLRRERYGKPIESYQQEIVDVPEIDDDEMLVCMMSAGINYNGVWGAKGIPKDLVHEHKIDGDKTDFHICGSEGSGIVYKVGKNIKNYKIGDELAIGGSQWDYNCPHIQYGLNPIYSPSFRIWGYEVNYGAFAQFSKVKPMQCLKKPLHLCWEETASYVVSGVTVYRMLYNWTGNVLKPNDVVLIWGGAGGLGSMAIQLVKHGGGIPVAVVSDESKFEFCMKLGAAGCINRNEFTHWGLQPHWKDKENYRKFLRQIHKFRKAMWKIIGEKRGPNIVIEHPGENTIPTSLFLCETGGMVVICGGTSGYNASFDLRPFWYFQKRLQGSHAGTTIEGQVLNKLIIDKLIHPVLSKIYTWKELPLAHQLVDENKHPPGNTSVLIGVRQPGMGKKREDVLIETEVAAECR
jgi:crotonyl-CoA carboxylase/reductase